MSFGCGWDASLVLEPLCEASYESKAQVWSGLAPPHPIGAGLDLLQQ